MSAFGCAPFWWRFKDDGATFIACRDDGDGQWYLPGVWLPVRNLAERATMLGPVARAVVGGASIDEITTSFDS
jgi:hypothetical protein